MEQSTQEAQALVAPTRLRLEEAATRASHVATQPPAAAVPPLLQVPTIATHLVVQAPIAVPLAAVAVAEAIAEARPEAVAAASAAAEALVEAVASAAVAVALAAVAEEEAVDKTPS